MFSMSQSHIFGLQRFRNGTATALGGLAAFCIGLGLASAPAQADIDLVFGTYSADKPTETVRKFKPFLAYLSDAMSDRLGEKVTIHMQVASKYEEGIQNLVEGHVDFARFGPASYVTAKSLAEGIDIIAMESKKGKKTFRGIIAVHVDSDVRSLPDLANRSFAFGSELSTIGRYLAQQQLLEAGISAEDLTDHAYLGRHDRVGAAVGKGDYDAGALKSSTFKKLVKKNVPIRELTSFNNVTKPWLSAPGLDPRIVTVMREVFLSTKDEEVLKNISKSGFLPGDDADYAPIREAMIRAEDFGG